MKTSMMTLNHQGTGSIVPSLMKAWPVLAMTVIVLLALFSPEIMAGTNTTFDALEAEADSSVFGPLGRAVIYLACLGGCLFAVIKGAWLMAGLGVAVAGLFYATSLVVETDTFGLVLPLIGA